MAVPTFVTASAGVGAGASPWAVAPSIATVQSDDILIAAAIAGLGSATFTTSSGWTSLAKTTNSDATFEWWWKRSTGTETPFQITSSGTANCVLGQIFGFRGCITTQNPVITQSLYVVASSRNTYSSSAITSLDSEGLVVYIPMIEDNSAVSNNPAAGWTLRSNFDDSAGTDARIQCITTSSVASGSTLAAVKQGDIAAVEFWAGLTLQLKPAPVSYTYSSSFNDTFSFTDNSTSSLTPFVPTALSNLEVWYDAQYTQSLYDATSGGNVITHSGAVARWEDRSGNNFHLTQSISGRRPVFYTSSLNSYPALTFVANSTSSLGKTDVGVLRNCVGSTAFVVVEYSNVRNPAWTLFVSTPTITTGRFGLLAFRDGAGNPVSGSAIGSRRLDADSFANLTSSTAITPNVAFVHGSEVDFVNTTARLYHDGDLEAESTSFLTSGSSSDTDAKQICVSSRRPEGDENAVDGKIGEVILYDRPLSDTERGFVEDYLIAKWNITSATTYTSVASDTFSFTDTSRTLSTYNRTSASVFSLTDSTATTAQYIRPHVDTLVLADATLTISTYNRVAADSFILADTTFISSEYNRSHSDSFLFSDSALSVLVAAMTYSSSVSDTFSFADTTLTLTEYNRVNEDSFTFTDTLLSSMVYSVAQSDSFSLADSTLTTLEANIYTSASDSFVLNDSTFTDADYYRSTQDSLTITDFFLAEESPYLEYPSRYIFAYNECKMFGSLGDVFTLDVQDLGSGSFGLVLNYTTASQGMIGYFQQSSDLGTMHFVDVEEYSTASAGLRFTPMSYTSGSLFDVVDGIYLTDISGSLFRLQVSEDVLGMVGIMITPLSMFDQHISDTFSLTDSTDYTTEFVYVNTHSDSFTLSDSVSTELLRVIDSSVSDILTFTDEQNRIVEYVRVNDDGVSVNDVYNRQFNVTSQTDDNIVITDELLTLATYNRNAGEDTFSLSESYLYKKFVDSVRILYVKNPSLCIGIISADGAQANFGEMLAVGEIPDTSAIGTISEHLAEGDLS